MGTLESSFTVKELSRFVGLPQRRIQFYVDKGFIAPEQVVSRGKGVAHRFSFNNLIELCIVRELHMMGVTIAMIKKILAWQSAAQQPLPVLIARAVTGRAGGARFVFAVIAFSAQAEIDTIQYIDYDTVQSLEQLQKYRKNTGQSAWEFVAEHNLALFQGLLELLSANTASIVLGLERIHETVQPLLLPAAS